MIGITTDKIPRSNVLRKLGSGSGRKLTLNSSRQNVDIVRPRLSVKSPAPNVSLIEPSPGTIDVKLKVLKKADLSIINLDWMSFKSQVETRPKENMTFGFVTEENNGLDGENDAGHRRGAKRLNSAVSAIYEFGDDEENEKKLVQMKNKYYYLNTKPTSMYPFTLN